MKKKKSTPAKVGDAMQFAWFVALIAPLIWVGKKLGRLPWFFGGMR